MPVVQCPIDGCSYSTPDLSDTVIVALLSTHAIQHNNNAPTAKVEKVKRPSITSSGTSEEWSYFMTRWTEYVAATKITGQDKVVQLLECCDESLRKDLTQSSSGSLLTKPIDEVLEAIKILAVREENTMVARVTLHNMHQDQDESVRSYSARLKGQAQVCKFVISCSNCQHDINYTESMIRDVLIRGIADGDIQLDILGHQDQNLSLEKTIKFVEAKESGKRSANRLLQSQGADAVRSSYKHSKRDDITHKIDPLPQTVLSDLCSYCGKKGHGKKAPPSLRKLECKAYNKTCNNCKKLHHFEAMCRGNKNLPDVNAPLSHSTENVPYSSLCSTSSDSNFPEPRSEVLNLSHHLYDNFTQTWIKQKSKPQPFINLTVSAVRKDYLEMGFTLKIMPKSCKLPVMADTGCQSCLAGMKSIALLGFRPSHLIPVNMRMHAANNQGINILGAVILRFAGQNSNGSYLETRQLTYVTDSSDAIFLSKEACVALGMISKQFPTVGEASSSPKTVMAATKTMQNDVCNCPKRELPPPPPKTLPYPATSENRERLQNYLLAYYKSSTFNTCPHQPLPLMKGPPMALMIDPLAKPIASHTPVPVPLHWQEEVKRGLDQDVQLGVIEPVPVGEPVTWCHRMVVCAKKDGKPRRTVDLQPLNAHATRETHHTQSPFHQVRAVPKGKKKTVFDAWNGYHSVPIRKEDRHLTTFITPWGRYRYCTAPQGYIASGDGYSRRYDEIVAHIPDKTKCIDDTLIWSDNIKDSFFQSVQWLDICGTNGITLNPTKFSFAKDDVDFAGFTITLDSVRPCEKYLQAIRDFPTPKNITDIRSWFGLVNQVSYAFSMAPRMLPFRDLLKPATPFQWNPDLNTAFTESKTVIIREIHEGVRIFDKQKSTCLATDWSKNGIGFWLSQKHCQCLSSRPFCCKSGWKVTLIGSRFTHPAESRYAPIEGEALAVADALEKAKYFVLGCTDLIIAVDHKPLLKVLGDRSLEKIPNSRLRNLKEKTLPYKFRIVHIPGAKHKAADSTSRSPSGHSSPPKLHLEDDISISTIDNETTSMRDIQRSLSSILQSSVVATGDHHLHHNVQSAMAAALSDMRTVTWNTVKVATQSDPELLELLTCIEDGISETSSELTPSIRLYHQYRDNLYSIDGVIIYKNRIVIPLSLRPSILGALHASHQGVSSMVARAEASVFWPGITADITATRSNCNHCNRMAPSQPCAPPVPPVLPAYPFQCICADYFQYKGKNYLVIVDRYSHWPIIERASEGANGLINCLKRVFATYGICDELSSDGGPEFTSSATRNFLQQWGVHHRLSSVSFPHSNCRAEVGVKIAKRLITDNTSYNGELDTDAFMRAILQYRNTPNQDTKLSPAMCIFGRPIKDLIPILPGKYTPHETWRGTLAAREEALRNRHMRMHEYWSEHTRSLAPLKVGDRVRIQNQIGNNPRKWDKTGLVVEVRQFDQYLIRVDGSGRTTLRNRKFIRKYVPVHALPSPTSIRTPTTSLSSPLTPALSPTCPTPPVKDNTHPPVTLHHSTPDPAVQRDNLPYPTSSSPQASPRLTKIIPSSPNAGSGTPTSPRPLETPRDMSPSSPDHPDPPSPSPASPDVRRSGRSRHPPTWHRDYQVQLE